MMVDLNTNNAADLTYMQAQLGIGGLAPSGLRPARIAIFGNSQAENNHATAGFVSGVPGALQVQNGREDKSAMGFAVYTEMVTGGRVVFPRSLNWGVSAENSDQMVARLPAAVAAIKAGGASAVCCICFTNDWGSAITLGQAKQNAATIEAAFLAAGIKVIWITEYPRGNAAATGVRLTGAFLANALEMHRWLHGRQDNARVLAVDAYSRLADASSASGDLITGMATDYLHLEGSGSYRVALALKPIIEYMFPPVGVLPVSAADMWSINNVTGSLNLNPMMVGTTGALNSNPGSLADSWTAPALPAGLPSAVATFAKATASDGYPIQRATLSGTTAATVQFWELLRRDTAIGGGLAVGGAIRAVLELSLGPAPTGIIALWAQIGANALVSRAPAPSSANANSLVPLEGFSGVVHVPEIVIPTGSVSVRLGIWALTAAGAVPVAGIVEVKRFALLPA